MAVSVQDVLMVDAVFVDLELLRDQREITECSATIGAELVPEGVLIAGSPQMSPVQGRVLRLPRDRIVFETSAHRTRVVREYPSSVDDLPLLVRRAAQAVSVSDLQGRAPASFGCNIQLVYEQDSGQNATGYLGRRLFIPTADLHEHWGLAGGFGKLLIEEGSWRWTITLEPRFNDSKTTKVFLDINLHVPERRMPDETELETLLGDLWNRAHSLIGIIDGRAHD